MKMRGCLLGVVIGIVLTGVFIWLVSGAEFLKGNRVGEIDIRGAIVSSRDTLKQIKDFRKNDSIKAILLRIESPGGVVGPSQEIYREIRRTIKIKPVVASLGSVAASGAYYIASAASYIIADPGTITGSIGVIIHFPNLEGLFDKIGYQSITIKSGPFKDIGNPDRKMTPEEKALLQTTVNQTYDQFVRAVAQGRDLPEDYVRKLADGRIIMGEEALKLKLVDQLGNYEDAVIKAGRLGGISGEPQVERARSKGWSLLDFIIGSGASERLSNILADSSASVRYQLPGFGQ